VELLLRCLGKVNIFLHVHLHCIGVSRVMRVTQSFLFYRRHLEKGASSPFHSPFSASSPSQADRPFPLPSQQLQEKFKKKTENPKPN